MKYILILILLATIYVFPVVAEEPEWVDPQEKTLRLEESIIRDKFLVEATSFFEDSVLITVYYNGIKIDNNVMRINNSWNVSNREKDDKEKLINITIKDFREDRGNISAQEGLNIIVDQWARVETRMAGSPLPLISIVPEEKHRNNRTIVNRIFGPYSEISINFTVKNNGKATLREPKLRINTILPLLFPGDKLYHELTAINSGDNITVNMRFRTPYIGYIGNRTNFTIFANVTGKDIFGRKYSSNDTIYIITRPYYDNKIELKKFVPERVYMGDVVIASLNIKNNMFGFETKNVTLTDSISIGFEILNGNGGIINRDNISWNIMLDSAEKTILYYMRPKKPGIYSLGNACIDDISVCSDVPNKVSGHKIIASGPYVELTKSIDKNINRDGEVGDGDVEIKIYIKNKGDRSAIVKLIDYVPKDYVLNGSNGSNGSNNNSDNNGENNNSEKKFDEKNFDNIFKTMIVRPQDTKLLNYTLSIDSKKYREYKLPPAKAIVLDQFLYMEDKYIQKVVSNSLIINNI